MKDHSCILCNKRTKPRDRRPLNGPSNQPLRKYLKRNFLIESFPPQSIICTTCKRLYYHKEQNSVTTKTATVAPDVNSQSNLKPFSPPSIRLPIRSSGRSHDKCAVCGEEKGKMGVIKKQTIYQYFIKTGVLLKDKSRCCVSHLSNGFLVVENAKSPVSTNMSFNKTGLSELLEEVRKIANKSGQTKLDFDLPGNLTDEDYMNLTGLHAVQFDDICEFTKSDVYSTRVRSMRSCVALLLVKLRTGVGNSVIGTLFGLTKFQVRRSITSAKNALLKSFVPNNLGFPHISRETVIDNHTRHLAKELFAKGLDKAILVLDGTYIYIQKSANFTFSRRSFSMHKHRPLIKPMMVVTTSGYIVSVLGPYLADGRNNDASILTHMIKTNAEEITNWIEEGDVVVVDRGFRDAASVLSDLGITMEMPAFLPRGEKQFSTETANKTRLITKIRWVVESANGRLKSWKYLNNVLPNSQISNAGDFVRIVSAICNKYRPPLSKGDEDSDRLMAAKLLHLSKKSNTLKIRVEEEGLDKRSGWKCIDADDVAGNFPIYSEEDLRCITVGVYQLKLATAYSHEHVDDSGTYTIHINDDVPDIIIAKIQSRHVSAKAYKCWIEYKEGYLVSWYCKCKSGSRVVGMCAHITSVVWYLSHQRHNGVAVPGVRNWTDSLCDAAEQ